MGHEGGRPVNENTLIAKLNLIASKTEHEDNLIGQRTTLLVTSQSFLFAAFVGIAVGVGAEGAYRLPLAKLLLVVVPLLGLLLPFLVLLSLIAASSSLSYWRTERERILHMPEAKELDWPNLDRSGTANVFGAALPYAASFAFLLAWVVILMYVVKAFLTTWR
jgi:hypothetical protein